VRLEEGAIVLGLVPKLLIDLVTEAHGPQTMLEIKRRANCSDVSDFRINEVYEDETWRSLVGATTEVLGCSGEELEEMYAKYFLKDAQRRWPVWFQMSKTAREFLERHPAVHNNFADAVRDSTSRGQIKDKFRIEKLDDKIITHYRSPNRHCHLYVSLAREVLLLYGEEATIEEPKCVKRGDPECEIWITWPTIN
jgi:heme-NO-binding protein